jgi:hypothetical protein
MLDWKTRPEIKVEGSSPKLEMGMETWDQVLAAGATGRLTEFPIMVLLTL